MITTTTTKNLIYSCVFFQKEYINLIKLLLHSYAFFANEQNNYKYLIICESNFKIQIENICNYLHINFDIFCMNLTTKFEAAFSRLKIFNYSKINDFKYILYLDCDILIINSLDNIFKIVENTSNVENKLYTLLEGTTNHDFWGQSIFKMNNIENPNIPAFTTAILLFKNSQNIKKLFEKILQSINNYIQNNFTIPTCLEQPFVIFHTIRDNKIYDNKELQKYAINNPKKSIENIKKIICHFPGNPGHYQSKFRKMYDFLIYKLSFYSENNEHHVNNNCSGINDNVINKLINKYFYVNEEANIHFISNTKFNFYYIHEYQLQHGIYYHINSNVDSKTIILEFKNNNVLDSNQNLYDNNTIATNKNKNNYKKKYIMKFTHNYSKYFGLDTQTLESFNGIKAIPKILFQTSKNPIESYVQNTIQSHIPLWKYLYFNDNDIINFFKLNPLEEFANIIEKFDNLLNGAHKADLFRYYFLYLNGGVFLDSDAILETNIYNIIKKYDAVFVKSFMPNTHLFNGFIAVKPKNKIIYEALKHAYNVDHEKLVKNYHFFCEELWKIYNQYKKENIKILQEINLQLLNKSIVFDNDIKNNNDFSTPPILISHYWKTKKITHNLQIDKFIDFCENNSSNGDNIENYNVIDKDFEIELFKIIKKYNIEKIIEFGCDIFSLINLPKYINYIGFDKIYFKNKFNQKKYENKKYRFFTMNIFENLDKIVDADMYICNDIFKHWTLIDIYTLFDYLIKKKKFKLILICTEISTKNLQKVIHNPLLTKNKQMYLHADYLPLKKYNAVNLKNYTDKNNIEKHICCIFSYQNIFFDKNLDNQLKNFNFI